MAGQTLSASGQLPEAPLRNLPQDGVDRPLAGFTRDYRDGESVERHAHTRAQLLYATRGVMRIATDTAAFVLPPGRALWMPARVPHVTAMQGPVAMRALFLRADAALAGPGTVTVMAVSPLLRELVLAACAEPLEWDPAGRGGHLAALILDEIARAPRLPLGLPVLRDARLRRLAAALQAEPAQPLGLEDAVEGGDGQPAQARGGRVRQGELGRAQDRLGRRQRPHDDAVEVQGGAERVGEPPVQRPGLGGLAPLGEDGPGRRLPR